MEDESEKTPAVSVCPRVCECAWDAELLLLLLLLLHTRATLAEDARNSLTHYRPNEYNSLPSIPVNAKLSK